MEQRTTASLQQVDQLERMAIAEREVGHTVVRPATGWVLLVTFLAMISAGTLAQGISGWRSTSSATTPASSATEDRPTPGVAGWSVFAANRWLLARIHELSDRLERESWVAEAIRPSAQKLLLKLGAGTEQVWQGRGDWLFFKPDVDHVTGPGFLGRRELERRAARGDTLIAPPQPDPRPAIRSFAQELSARGIALLVVPTPVKPSVHPEQLASGTTEGGWVANPSRESFLGYLREAGVLVFDPRPVMLDLKRRRGTPLYLATDTHWRPETVQAVARELGVFITKQVELPEVPSPGYRQRAAEIANTGDIAELLGLAADDQAYPPERVTVSAITTSSGEPWRAETSADVLVLGDSFSNVFSLVAMGWGESGGLVEQLSFSLERPIDRLTRNDEGAFAPRRMLADELRRGRDRLAGKRLVIYQFAERELSQGDWKRIRLGGPPTATSAFLTPVGSERLLVRGTIADLATAPRPGTVPYKDHIIAVHLTGVAVEQGSATGEQALVYVWSMRDNVLTAAATYRPGQTIRLRLTPWGELAPELEGINRAEIGDDAVRLAEPWWAEPVDTQ
jgi:alginate O-acetyltransferase complex protein AlgJ